MKDNDSKLISEAYEQKVQEGALGDIAIPMKDNDTHLIAEAYFRMDEGALEYAPEEADSDDQLGEMESLDNEEEEVDLSNIENSLNNIGEELKILNQYAEIMTAETRAKAVAGTTVQK